MFCFLAADSLFTVYGALYVIDYPEFNLTPNSLISIIYKVAIILASEIIIQFRDHRRSIDDCLSVNIAFVRVDLANVGLNTFGTLFTSHRRGRFDFYGNITTVRVLPSPCIWPYVTHDMPANRHHLIRWKCRDLIKLSAVATNCQLPATIQE